MLIFVKFLFIIEKFRFNHDNSVLIEIFNTCNRGRGKINRDGVFTVSIKSTITESLNMKKHFFVRWAFR